MFSYQPPPHNQLDIRYCDDDILVINKPAGLLSVPGRAPEHQDCMISRVQLDYPEALIVHRLDLSTSGLMVMARGKEAHRNLNRQFAQRRVEKTYIAVVHGSVDPAIGTIDLPLICDWPNRPRQIVDHTEGKSAQTEYRTLHYDASANSTRIELKPITGRTHQLRVHMQALGHPILGDDLYADDATLQKADRLLLHAESLAFAHPSNQRLLSFKQPAPF
ncbi:MAG TPA: RluA family pseudouridine synthase [Geopsychrobacteraceae bacterium]|nr:RluA family pseudouridine synthase [Geopsychrobacteraceae bacterium]